MKRILFLILSVLIGTIVYHSALIEIIGSVLHREGSSSGFFVPIFTAIFLWSRWESIRKAEKRFLPIVIPLSAILLVVPPVLTDSYRISFIFFVFYLASLVLMFYGKTAFRYAAFPVLFLIAMTPITGKFYNQMAEATRYLTFHISVGLISVLGVPNYTEGWMVHLPNALLNVELACSGIRYLVSYFAFGIAYAYFYKKNTGSRLLLVALTIPFSIFASSIRLFTIFMMAYYISPKMAEFTPHLITSWVIFAAFLVGGFALDQVVSRYWNKGKAMEAESGA